jgi:hypothetical protein
MTINDVKIGQTLVCGNVEMKVVSVTENKVTCVQEHNGQQHEMTISASAFTNPHLRQIAIKPDEKCCMCGDSCHETPDENGIVFCRDCVQYAIESVIG